MRTLMVMMMLMAGTAAHAQEVRSEPSKECFPSAHIDKVVVELSDGSERKGSLLCLGPSDLTLAGTNAVERVRLDDVRYVRKAPDPVWDGAAKGASIGLLMLVLCHGECPASAVLRTTAAYGLLGLSLDAIDTNAEKIYGPAKGKAGALNFRVGF